MKKKPSLHIVPDPGIIEIRGARQNNLKGFDLDVPLGKLSVISGPSGSGKSSLAFDTIYAEGQRRYVETFSPYTRQFLERMDKPKVDEIRGIPPAIAIEQSNPVKTTRARPSWINVLDSGFNLHLRQPALGHAWSVRMPTKKGRLASVELYDEAGEMVVQFFGKRKPGQPEMEEWRALAADLRQ